MGSWNALVSCCNTFIIPGHGGENKESQSYLCGTHASWWRWECICYQSKVYPWGCQGRRLGTPDFTEIREYISVVISKRIVGKVKTHWKHFSASANARPFVVVPISDVQALGLLFESKFGLQLYQTHAYANAWSFGDCIHKQNK